MPQDVTTHSSTVEIAIVLCTYNGVRYVEEQVESLLAQEHSFCVVACDDASTDETVMRLSECLRPGIDSLVKQSSNRGYVRNFETTLNRALESGASYFALSDQDDIWEKNRIACGRRKMADLEKVHGMDAPLLVHSDLCLIDSNKQPLHDSFLAYRHYRISSQKNLAIVLGENGVMGNTILMNQAMAKLCLPFPAQLHVHDYWIALLAELYGQRALIEKPLVKYRLHAQNASNTATSMRKGYHDAFSKATWKKLWNRNFKLPFKEDSRLLTLDYLLENGDSFPDLSAEKCKQIESFRRYLIFTQPRLKSYLFLLQSNMVRKGIRYRLKLFFVIMLTCRYKKD